MAEIIAAVLIYIIGVIVAYSQILEWANRKIESEEDSETVHLLSLLSWLVYPAYWLTQIVRKVRKI